MHAAKYDRCGPAKEVLKLAELPDPQPGDGEVRVKVAASGVNPSDVKTRAGQSKRASSMTFPVVPHSDGAGIIDAVGPGVPRSRIGERVWMYNAQYMRAYGTAAEYIALPSRQAVRLADDLSLAEGACLGIPASTAHRAVTLFGPVESLTVLVQGASGAVGNYAVQFAKADGATVIGTVSSDEKAAHARRAGADHTINYRTENVVERIRDITGGKGVDRVVEVDLAANGETYPEILAQKAKVAIYGASASYCRFGAELLIWLQPTFQFFGAYVIEPEARQAAIDAITRLCADGTLKHTIGKRFAFDEIVAAHEAVEGGKVLGNVVLDIADLDI